MTRRLILLRHGQAADPGHGPDFDRPLTPRGRLDIGRAAELLAQAALVPTHIHASAAARTEETATIVRDAIAPTIDVACRDELYLAEADVLDVFIDSLSDGTHMIVGHDPDISTVARRRAGGAWPTAWHGLAPGALVAFDAAELSPWPVLLTFRP